MYKSQSSPLDTNAVLNQQNCRCDTNLTTMKPGWNDTNERKANNAFIITDFRFAKTA